MHRDMRDYGSQILVRILLKERTQSLTRTRQTSEN